MPEPIYPLPENPAYCETIRKLQDNDPASASQVLNPLISAVLENIHFVKLDLESRTQGLIHALMTNELTLPLTTDSGEALLMDGGTPILAAYRPVR